MNEKTQREKLLWSISLLGTEPIKDVDYIGEYIQKRPIKNTFEELTGTDIKDFYEGGMMMSVDDYLKLNHRISGVYMNQVKNFINKEFKSYTKPAYSNLAEYIVDIIDDYNLYSNIYYSEFIQNKWIKTISKDVVDRLLIHYYTFKGVRAGFLDNYEPSVDEFNDIMTINKDEIIDLYILLNGGYLWNDRNPTFEDFKRGQYVGAAYQSIKYIARGILQNEPELIGCRSVIIERERIIDNILG